MLLTPYIWHHADMHKTTLYLPKNEVRRLKQLAARRPGGSVTQLIRQAIHYFLTPSQRPVPNTFLRRTLRKAGKKTTFGDGVRYQRQLRDEWA